MMMVKDHPELAPVRLERAAAGLRPLEREALRLNAGGKFSVEEIAGRLGIPAGQVAPLTARALVRLERALARQERPWWRFWRVLSKHTKI
jgi:DNA-directed RNA polymerase specialized sigma24 family protein